MKDPFSFSLVVAFASRSQAALVFLRKLRATGQPEPFLSLSVACFPPKPEFPCGETLVLKTFIVIEARKRAVAAQHKKEICKKNGNRSPDHAFVSEIMQNSANEGSHASLMDCHGLRMRMQGISRAGLAVRMVGYEFC